MSTRYIQQTEGTNRFRPGNLIGLIFIFDLSGGVKFSELSAEEAYHFQENLLRTMVQIENTYFDLGKTCRKNCLIICDRGAMDASACKSIVSVTIRQSNGQPAVDS